MQNTHNKNTVRYYLILVFLFLFFFFSNDFGLIDVQKTAIVMAVGIDREDDTFIITSQIAVPQSSKNGKSTQAVQLVSRGKTVGEALDEINAKTGWYPKLVFCNLILIGNKAAEENVFDALDYFLRDEYLSDNCMLATCDGLAKEFLDTSALIENASSTAMRKVLSAHAEQVGTVLPTTLREFSIGYFSESQSGYLPILKIEPQQEHVEKDSSSAVQTNTSENSQQNNTQEQKNKPVFSARETALFVSGKKVAVLDADETFALSSVLSKLRLASYTIEREGKTCSLTIKNNRSEIKLQTSESDFFSLDIHLTMTAGILDFSVSQDIDNIRSVGDVPMEFFTVASAKLESTIATVYEKCRAVNCDLFGVRERLVKYKKKSFKPHENTIFEKTRVNVSVRFQNVR